MRGKKDRKIKIEGDIGKKRKRDSKSQKEKEYLNELEKKVQ